MPAVLLMATLSSGGVWRGWVDNRDLIYFQLRKITESRGHLPDKDSAMKLLYLGLRNISSQRAGYSGTGTSNWAVTLKHTGRNYS
jgi:hypothetical protein